MSRFVLCLIVCLVATACSGSGKLRTSSVLGLDMVRIEGGAFLMGDSFEGSNDDALPVHAIDVETFYIARFETTFEDYGAYARLTEKRIPLPEERNRGRRAVAGISWNEAVAYCEYVGARLPSEQEWEYAAAGGSAKQKYAGTNDDLAIDEFVSYRENSHGESLPVGQKKPNLFGLFDMSGNVGEWVSDYYEKYPETGGLPVYNNPDIRDMRIVRGGGVSSEPHVTRTYWRAGTLRYIRTPSIGFRCARHAN